MRTDFLLFHWWQITKITTIRYMFYSVNKIVFSNDIHKLCGSFVVVKATHNFLVCHIHTFRSDGCIYIVNKWNINCTLNPWDLTNKKWLSWASISNVIRNITCIYERIDIYYDSYELVSISNFIGKITLQNSILLS